MDSVSSSTTSKTSKPPSVLGGACIIACICVGAGMLGLPSAGAGAWTIGALFTLIVTMLVMITSGCLLLEALKAYPYKSSFSSITVALLGNKINLINNLMIYFVGGILLYAYITSSGLILFEYTGLNPKLASILFVLAFSFPVWHSTRTVDRISIVLIVFMLLSFTFGIIGLWINIDFTTLIGGSSQVSNFKYIWALFPIALTAFGYHHAVPTMRDYYRDEKLAQKAIIGGALIALFIYSVWLISIYGNIARDSFGPIIAQGGNIDALLINIQDSLAQENLSRIISAFSAAAILSSFIGVGLGVFDFLADVFKFETSQKGRTKTWAITFLPPLIFSLAFPFGFLTAIGYAAAAAAFWTCIVPALLVRKMRQNQPSLENEQDEQLSYRVIGGDMVLITVSLFGLGIIVIHFLVTFDTLPQYSS